MKKFLTLVLLICIGAFSGNTFGQEKTTRDKKGGFAVGGYDNTRQEEKATVTKRSVVITDEETPAEKAAEEAIPEQVAAPAPAPAPAMAPPAPEGKDKGQARSQDTRDKQKPRKDKSKGKRR